MGGLGGVFILGDMGLEYGNEKRVCTRFDVVLAFFVSVLIVLKFVGEYDLNLALKFLLCLDMIMNPLFHTDFSISDSLKSVRKSVLIYETII